MRLRRLAVVIVVPLLAWPPDRVSGQSAPPPDAAAPPGPVLRLGALLPLSGPGAWFGNEIKRGIELAVAEVKPAAPKAPGPPTLGTAAAPGTGAAPTGDPPPVKPSPRPSAVAPRTEAPSPERDGEPADAAGESTAPGDSGTSASPLAKAPPPEPVEAPDRARTFALALLALDVQPLDLKAAGAEMSRLLASGVTAVVTASPTPTLAAYPLASSRDVLLLHAGLPSDRFPAAGRTLLQLRPSVDVRAETLAAHLGSLGIKRLALLAGGDDFGRAVRAGAATRWRKQGGVLTHEESLSLDAADLRSRLRPVARAAPEAVVLGYQGATLGEAARALRGAGYAGRLLAVDDDRAALLAAGPALDGAMILSDAFVPVPGTRGARFARAYEAAVLLADAAPPALRGGGITGSRLREVIGTSRRYPSLYAGNVRLRDDGTLGRPLALFRVEGSQLAFDDYIDGEGRALGVPKGKVSPPKLDLAPR
jgi:ABC-type branched-subunit amino acid transport system substrate-binding protein